tara:strand:- start:172 stop:372 length:201 start_codon:yes stop_codon:yes gene_type:complete
MPVIKEQKNDMEEKGHCECDSHIGECINISNMNTDYKKRMDFYFENKKRKISQPITIVQNKNKNKK